MDAYSTQVERARQQRTLPQSRADWYHVVAKMKITLERTAWILALVGAALFIVGGVVSNTMLSRAGLIAALTGVVWAIGLRARDRS